MKTFFRKILKFIKKLILVVVVLHLLSLVFLYFKQERFFFNPKTLDKNYSFNFTETFNEVNIPVDNNVSLNALHFKTENPKGIVLYFHGNAGAIHEWGTRAPLFLNQGYDVLFVDYRGYGKSDGYYTEDKQLFSDAQKVYDYTKTLYPEDKIVVLGFSLGSGIASYVASKNNPKLLIINAPYYDWKTLITEEIAPPLPRFIVNYDIPTFKFLETVKCPIQIYHGSRDFLIKPKTNSERLKALFPEKTNLTYIKEAGHNSIHITCQYANELAELLN